LPDEQVGDMLRDGDEVVAELEGDGTQLFLASKSYIGRDTTRTAAPLEAERPHGLMVGSPLENEVQTTGLADHLMIENMTPKLREFVLSRFEDAIEEPHC